MIHKLGGLPSFELIPKREHVFQTGQPYSKIGWTRALNAISTSVPFLVVNVLLISAKTRLAFVHILLT
jgi:formate hydrogenlyase subunit 4